jgi:hypothetical protein
MFRGNGITDFLRKSIFTRENLWAIAVAVMLIAIYTCATVGIQPQFIYTGF